jgi:hypothetical protein
MRPTILSLIAGAAIVLSACSSGSPTQAPGGATQAPAQATADGGGGGTGATEPPAATSGAGGGGGGTGSTANGSAHVELSGPASKSGDYGLVAPASIFGGAQGTALSYTNDAATDVLTISFTSDSKVIVSYGGADLTAPGAECTASNLNIGASSASGSFDCQNVMVVTAAGATLTGATMKGAFTAHA